MPKKELLESFLKKNVNYQFFSRTERFEMETIFWQSEMLDFGEWELSKWPQYYDKLDKNPYDWLWQGPLNQVYHNLQ